MQKKLINQIKSISETWVHMSLKSYVHLFIYQT